MASLYPIDLQFFGLPRLVDGEQNQLNLRGRKSAALLAYLALTYPQVHSRERLSGLLWPELSDKDARNNLRVTLARISKNLDFLPAPAIRVDRLNASFSPSASVRCDVFEFKTLLISVEEHTHDEQLSCEHCYLTRLRINTLYKAELMEGFQLDGCEEFDEWQYELRECLKLSAFDNLSILGRQTELKGDLSKSEELTRQLLRLDPLREEAHRRLLKILVRKGERHKAIAHISLLKWQLNNELGVEPDETTQVVISQIENGTLKQDCSVGIGEDKKTIASNGADLQVPNNLPIEKSPYIGNRKSLEQLSKHIKERRLITLTGIGGVGKTRLAVQIGRDSLADFPGGVWFVRLASLSTRAEILSSLASVLKVQLLPGDDPITSITGQLDKTKRLLILDNFEHLLPENDIVGTLLGQSHEITILVTSRQKLSLIEEAVFHVSGLSHIGRDTRIKSDDIGNDAADLFVDVARRTVLGFDFGRSHADEISQITRLVEGHPLALVIAASWIDGMSCKSIREELERGLGILETDSNDVPERQRSIRATFNYSWKLLNPEEQRMFATLAVFRGGFDSGAALEIAGATAQQLTGLVRKSLLHHYPEQNRYEIHELLRQYGQEQLDVIGDEASIAVAHSKHYLSALHKISGDYSDDNANNQQRLFSEDFYNIRKAWFLAIETQQNEHLAKAASDLRIMCSLGAHSHDLLDLLQPALPLIANRNQDSNQRDLVLNILLAIGFAYRYTKGYFARELNDIFARAYSLTSELETSPELFVILYGRWSFNFTSGQLQENMEIISQWRMRLSQLDESSQSLPYIKDAEFVINMLEGPQLQIMGQLTAARQVMQSGLSLEDKSRYTAIMGHYGLNFAVSGRHWLAINQCVAGLIHRSEQTIADAHTIAETENNPYLRMFVTFGQLIIFTLRKDVKQILYYAAAVNKLVSEHRIFHAFQHHADIYAAYAHSIDDVDNAVGALQTLVESGAGIPIFHLFDAQLLADVLVRAGRPEEAIDSIESFTATAKQKEILVSISDSARIVGDAHSAMGDYLQGMKHYQEALDFASNQEAGLYQVRISLALARNLAALDRPAEAIVLLSPIVERFKECRDLLEYDEAALLLSNL